MALLVFRNEPKALSHRLFAAMMTLLAAESLFDALAIGAIIPGEMAFWQRLEFVPVALLPGTWIFFSLVYSRGNYPLYLLKWRPVLAVFFAGPLILLTGFFDRLIVDMAPDPAFQRWRFLLGWSGVAMHAVLLVGGVLALMNLERTFRASVGTMRWRVKLVILGLGFFSRSESTPPVRRSCTGRWSRSRKRWTSAP